MGPSITTNQDMPNLDIDTIRAHFPGLGGPDALLDNAGGSQLPRSAIARAVEYMEHSFVQLGADYATSISATRLVERAHRLSLVFVGGEGLGQVAIGPSTSALLAMLADCFRRAFDASRPEIVVAQSGHESNIGPWVRLAEHGWTVHFWRVDPQTQTCPLAQLEQLVGPRTRLVALAHVSNLLGEIVDIAEVCRIAHAAGAKVVVDGVAFAPHRAVDVGALGADFYALSTYKVYGPHMALLFGTHEALAGLEGPNHFFVPGTDVPYKLELGGVLHEGCAAWLGTFEYLAWLAGAEHQALDRATIEAAFDRVAALEGPLMEPLLDNLAQRPQVRIIGPVRATPHRVPTVSFVHDHKSSREIACAANDAGFGIRHGHFYAHRLCTALGLVPEDGVVRVSLAHYNANAEVQRLIDQFDRLGL